MTPATTTNQRQAARRNNLNNRAQAAGWPSWSAYETACLNNAVKLAEAPMTTYIITCRTAAGSDLQTNRMNAHFREQVERAFSDHMDVIIYTEEEYEEYLAKYR